MKYRIKITTFESLRKEYRAQVRLWCGWSDIAYDGKAYYGVKISTSKRDNALDFIDKHHNGNNKVLKVYFEYITK